jgi:hypothetical protein
MATDKKTKPSGLKGKDDPVRQAIREGGSPEEMWERVVDLAVGFERAAAPLRSQELAEMGHILHRLADAPEFRRTVYRSLKYGLKKDYGPDALLRRIEERVLRTGVEAALLIAPRYMQSGDDHESEGRWPTHHRHLVHVVATTILGLLPRCPLLYGRTTCPPLTGDAIGLLWDDRDKYRETVRRVEEAIASRLVDPDDANPEAVVRAAMRALGVEANYVKHMFRE